MNKALLVLALVAIMLTGFGDPLVTVDKVIENNIEQLMEFYKHRHQHPEISLQEKQTSAELASELRKVGFEVTEGVGGYGIVAMLRNGDGPQILYRTDMDALPMYERTGLDYASSTEITYDGVKTGTMHSCGHDMHMTSLLGTAMAMVEMKDQWSGTLMLIGQPAEEIGQGARMMLAAGLYERFGVPDYGMALHCSPTIPAGQIGIAPGFVLATTESVDITVHGFGAHGAAPHMSIDPVVMASMIVMDLQTIVSRNLKPTESAVITVGAIQGGVKHNIIPDRVTLKLTLRTYKEEVRQMVHRRIEEVARGVAIAAGMPEDKLPEVVFPDEFTPANYNDPDLVEQIKASAAKGIGSENVKYAEPAMVGEDFAEYGNTEHDVPTTLYWLGTAPPERIQSGDLPGLHSPFYYPEPETSITTAIKVNVAALVDIFNKS